jgi:outer membrane protein
MNDPAGCDHVLMRVAIALFLAALSVSVRGEPVGGLTLDDYYAAALKRSESIATQTELIRQAEERLQQAEAARLPTVSGVGTYTRQEEPPPGTAITSTTASRQTVTRITASQPLFRGMREFAAVRQTTALRDAQGEEYRQARLLLFRDVVQNFYNVLSIEQDLRNIREEINHHLGREKDIQARVKIGRARVSELLNVQASVSTLRAQIEQLQGQLRTAREVFAFLSGRDADTVLRDSTEVPAATEALESYLAGIDARPDVKAARQRLTAAKENVDVARGAHRPSLDLNGNYYFERPENLKDITWDVQLALTVPLYAGGSLQSRVREAASQRTQAELALEQARRQAEQEIRSLFQTVNYNRTQVEALAQATEAARLSYEAQSREYRLGLVTNLDVLTALTAYQQNQRTLDRARYNVKADYLRLLSAAALRPVETDNAP